MNNPVSGILAACPGAAGMIYLGGGSGTGENNLSTFTSPALPPPDTYRQNVAPMSRFLGPTTGPNGGVCGRGATAEGLVIGLDGLSVLSDGDTAAACGSGVAHTTSFTVTVNGVPGGTLDTGCAGCDPGTATYTLSSWADALRIIYMGALHVAAAPPAVTPAARDCNGNVRKSLLNQFGEIFQAGCGGGTTCTELRHAFRRNDLSGTTDTFYTLLSEAYDNPGPPVVAQLRLPALPTTTTARESAFCNAFGAGNILAGQGDFLDQDPVRRPCGAQEQACRRDGTVGVVVPIEVPGGAALAQLYPTLGCSVGQFELLRLVPPGQPGPTVCPNGGPLALAGCFQPVRRLAPPAATPFDANCVAGVAPVQPLFGGGMSGRAYNLMVKNSAGLLQRDIFQPPAPYPTRFLVGSYFRIHTTQVLPGGTNTCQQPSSTEQLGCVVQASLCSISFAGREAALQPGSLSLSVGGLFPTNANVEALVLTPGNKADDYKLSRKLYFNTVAGFQGAELPGDERALAECASNPATAAAAMTGNGFIPMPASLGVQCEDFDETQCSGVVTNSRACSDNVAPVPGCRTAGQGCVQTGDCCAPLTCTGGSCS